MLFSNVNNLKSLKKEQNCFTHPSNLSCIDLFLTNRSRYFQNTSTTETRISDFYKLVVTVLKMFLQKKPKIIKCMSYTAQKMKLSTKDFFNKCDQIRSFLRISSHILKKSLMENFTFCVVP